MFLTLAAIEVVRQREREMVSAAESARRLRGRGREMEVIPASAQLPWARLRDYAGAVRMGDTVEVGGTSAIGEDGRILHPGDPYAQTLDSLEGVRARLAEHDADLSDVVVTRVYLKKAWQWEDVTRALRETFGGARRLPATTLVGASALVHPDALVQVEATARLRG